MSTAKKAETILSGLLALLERSGNGVIVQRADDTKFPLVGGQLVDWPVVAYRPGVRNTSRKNQKAVANV